MRFIYKPNAKCNLCKLGLSRHLLFLGSLLCCLQYMLSSQAIAGARVNTPGQIKLFLNRQTSREEVKKSALPSPFRDIKNIVENQAYIEHGWRPDITLTGNIVFSVHQTGKNSQKTHWLEVGMRHKADWAKLNIIPLKFDSPHPHKNMSKAASIKFGLVHEDGCRSITGLNLALSQGEKIQISNLNYLELLVEINQELVIWSSEAGFYRARNKIMLGKKGVSLNYHRLDSFGFGENPRSEHIGYLEFEFPATILLGKDVPKTAIVKFGKSENIRKGIETSKGDGFYLQLKFDLKP